MDDANKIQNKEDRQVLREFLNRFRRCRGREKRLNERQMMVEEYQSAGGIRGKHGDSSSGGARSERSDNTVTLLIEAEDIKERIDMQRKNSARVLAEIMDILAELPEGSDERDILERKYIDLQNEYRICREMSISRSKMYSDINRGLDMLLQLEWVQDIIEREKKKR